MADIIDRANDRAEEILADTFRDRELARKPRDCDYCVDCGDEIPPNRREFSKFVIRCLDCQCAHELRVKQGRE
jgi:RNA polymerase-binding transcription factor DksA